jgi:hypothetical protein
MTSKAPDSQIGGRLAVMESRKYGERDASTRARTDREENAAEEYEAVPNLL